MNERTNERTNERANKRASERTNVRTNERTNNWSINRQTERTNDQPTDRSVEWSNDRLIDRLIGWLIDFLMFIILTIYTAQYSQNNWKQWRFHKNLMLHSSPNKNVWTRTSIISCFTDFLGYFLLIFDWLIDLLISQNHEIDIFYL